jgi:hypothetical protein
MPYPTRGPFALPQPPVERHGRPLPLLRRPLPLPTRLAPLPPPPPLPARPRLHSLYPYLARVPEGWLLPRAALLAAGLLIGVVLGLFVHLSPGSGTTTSAATVVQRSDAAKLPVPLSQARFSAPVPTVDVAQLPPVEAVPSTASRSYRGRGQVSYGAAQRLVARLRAQSDRELSRDL